MFALLILAHLIFLYFFWYIGFNIGIYIVLFFLSIFFVFVLVSDEGQGSWKDFFKNFFLEYIIYINFLVILLGLFFVLNYFYLTKFNNLTFSYVSSSLTIIFISILIFLGGALFGSDKFIKLSLFSQLVFWLYLFYLIKDIKIFNYFIAVFFSQSLVSLLIYFVRFWKYNKLLGYYVFLSFVVILFILLHKYLISNIVLLSVLVQIFIGLVLLFILFIYSLNQKLLAIQDKLKKRQNDINLFGYSDLKLNEKELKFYQSHKSKQYFYNLVIDFFIYSPFWVKVLFSLTNTIPILIASIVFFYNFDLSLSNQIYYWIGAILYFTNYLLFKKLNWFVAIQRIFAFFVINFVTYFTIIYFFGKNYLYIAIVGILWNLLTTIIMLFIGRKGSLLEALDYLIWSIINFIAVFINLYFLFKSGLNFYLTMGISLLYFGFYLLLYRFVYKRIFY